MSSTNHSPSLESIIAESSTRRGFVQAGLGALAVNFFDSPALASAQHAPLPFSFTSVPVSSADKVMVPDGYQATPLYRWGDPANGSEPAFRPDASNSAADQRRQAGMGHDGMQWFSRPGDKANESQRGLLVINHEYTDQGLLFPDGIARMSAEKIEKSKNAHGISVIAVEQHDRHWHVVTSKWTRRITADTEMIITGPAAGSTHTITKADPEGKKVLGTFNNCASGKTPWGTYLTCEENFHGYFGSENTSHQADQNQRRYGLKASGKTSGDSGLSLYHWWADDDRFDLDKHPNEANRFGYVVEIDPSDPKSTPRKHSALGRFKHENAELTLAADGRVVVYMGDDEKNEYIYKFISKDRYDGKPENRAAHLRLLEKGTLYVAKFHSGGGGEWVALQHGKNGLTPKHGFANLELEQGRILWVG